MTSRGVRSHLLLLGSCELRELLLCLDFTLPRYLKAERRAKELHRGIGITVKPQIRGSLKSYKQYITLSHCLVTNGQSLDSIGGHGLHVFDFSPKQSPAPSGP